MRDMTKGAPLGHLFLYAVPLLLGNWLQLAYNAVDSIIAGRFIGQDALAAEGVAGPVMNLVILAISGLCIGAGVLMSEAFGAKRTARLKETLATTLLFGAALCCAAAALGCALTPWILRALAVPDSIFGITGIYLRITFLGAPFTFFYNALAAGLKSVGDSKTPLKFLAFSAVLNAVLDLILIGGLGFGIVCSAVTTVVAEAASALLAAACAEQGIEHITPVCADLRSFREGAGSYDLCACNPPYFTAGEQAADRARATARHETDCTLEDVCACGFRLLKDGGKLSLCHRPERLAEVLAVLRAHRLEPKRLAFVKNRPDAAPWLFLVEAQKNRKTGLRVESDVLISAGAAMYGR